MTYIYSQSVRILYLLILTIHGYKICKKFGYHVKLIECGNFRRVLHVSCIRHRWRSGKFFHVAPLPFFEHFVEIICSIHQSIGYLWYICVWYYQLCSECWANGMCENAGSEYRGTRGNKRSSKVNFVVLAINTRYTSPMAAWQPIVIKQKTPNKQDKTGEIWAKLEGRKVNAV